MLDIGTIESEEDLEAETASPVDAELEAARKRNGLNAGRSIPAREEDEEED